MPITILHFLYSFLRAKLLLEALRGSICLYDVKNPLDKFPNDIEGIHTKTWDLKLTQQGEWANIAKVILSNSFSHETAVDEVATFVLGCTKYPLKTPRGQADFLGPLHFAAVYDLKELVALAASFQHPIFRSPSNRQLALRLACRRGDYRRVEALIALPDTDINMRDEADGWTALMEASNEGHVEIVQLLLEVSDIDINAADAAGWTALHLASMWGRSKAVKALVKAPGIDVNARNALGSTALIEAAIDGDNETVQTILEVPMVDVNASALASALDHASAMGYEDIVRMLLAMPDVNVNARNAKGLTCLGWASRRRHRAVVAILLDAPGIRADCVDDNGCTPLKYAVDAVKGGDQEIIDLIVDFWIQRCMGLQGDAEALATQLEATCKL